MIRCIFIIYIKFIHLTEMDNILKSLNDHKHKIKIL